MTCVIRLHGELTDLAPPVNVVSFDVMPTLKDAVEGLGVPHTEAEGALDERLVDGCEYDLVPATHRDRPVPATFDVDDHLRALARRLRLLGFVTDGGAILLTRNRARLKRAAVVHGRLVRSEDPDEQLLEVVRAFDLAGEARPFTRCTACGGPLRPVAKADVADRLEPGTLATYDRFTECSACAHVFWAGAHHERLVALVARAIGTAPPGRA